MLGKLTSIVSGGTPKRFNMLRHSRFIQFPTLNFTKELTPHDMHWIIEEALEDQGVSDINSNGPNIQTHWTKIVPGENGKESNVADYMPFEGGFTGSRGEAVPSWVKLAIFGAAALVLLGGAAQVVALSILGILGVAGLSIFTWYWKTYRCGTVSMLYRGTYMKPENDSANPNDWRFSVDMMFSVNVKKPMVGTAIGSEVVAPIYAYIESSLTNDLRSERTLRSMPELVSRKASDYEKRFPMVGGQSSEF